jgi:predicted CXXCH cytochrome family protein
MSCHDGQAQFGTSSADTIKDQGKVIAKRHRRHRVEFSYPAPEGFIRTPGQVVTDETGHSYVLGTDGTRLPLYKDAKSGRLKGGCPTCHDPHQPGQNHLFLRTASVKELCKVCHNR